MKKTKQPLRQAQKPKNHELRRIIVSFRLRNSEVAALKTDMEKHPSTGVSSLKQFCRKLVVDYIADLLVYVNPKNRQTGNFQIVRGKLVPTDQKARASETCDMTDAAFLKALHRFLDDNEDNWKKLRAFMLGFGWPEHQAKEFRDTLDDYERLQLARKMLAKMIKSL